MKKKLFFGMAGLAIMAAAVTATIASVNASSNDSDLLSQSIEALTQSENGCVTNSNNDGDCTTDGTIYFCENSFAWHDCQKGVY